MGTNRRVFLTALPWLSVGLSGSVRSQDTEAQSVNRFDAVRRMIEAALAAGKATGLAISLARDGRIIWQEGFGWANREHGLKATAHTPFPLASITKPILTTAIATLAAEGRLGLDEPANRYLGSTPIRASVGADAVTIRELGAHAGGLPSLFEMYPVAGEVRPPGADEILRAYGAIAYPPGTLYEYSNIGYVALGLIASRVTGLDISAVITRRVLEPLGLHDSFFDTDPRRLRQAAARYDELGRLIPYYTTATPASGEVYASAHDLAQFALFHLKRGRGVRRPPLSDQWINSLQVPVLHGPSAGATTFGWFSGATRSGHAVLFKDGGQPGVSTIMYLVPAAGIACVVLANRTDNSDLAQTLVDLMISGLLPDWSTPDTSMRDPRRPLPATSVYAGRWSGRLSGGTADIGIELDIDPTAVMVLRAAQGVLTLSAPELEGAALVASGTGFFNARDVLRLDARKLYLKVLAAPPGLTGRILAVSSSPGTLATLPLTLSAVRSAD